MAITLAQVKKYYSEEEIMKFKEDGDQVIVIMSDYRKMVVPTAVILTFKSDEEKDAEREAKEKKDEKKKAK